MQRFGTIAWSALMSSGFAGCSVDPATEVSTTFPCRGNEFVLEGACVTCPPGTKNPAGDDPMGADTECEAVVCGEDEFVDDNLCKPCPEGFVNEAGDDASGDDTQCLSTFCDEDERVADGTCVECAPGSTNRPGDDPRGSDTVCDPVRCDSGERVSMNTCVPCPPGMSNGRGDDAMGEDTTCDVVFCLEDERVESNRCVPCPPGLGNAAGDDATGMDTICDEPVADFVDCASPNCVTRPLPGGATRYTYSIPGSDHPTTDDVEASCFRGYSASAIEAIFEIDVTGFTMMSVDTCRVLSARTDSSVAVFDGFPGAASTELLCSEDANPISFCAQVGQNGGDAPIPFRLPPGATTVYVVVDQWDDGEYWDSFTTQTIDIELIP